MASQLLGPDGRVLLSGTPMPLSFADRGASTFRSIGRTGLMVQQPLILDESEFELQGQQGKLKFRQMREDDTTIGALMFAIEYILRGISWDIRNRDESRAATRAGDLVRAKFTNMAQSWHETFSQIVSYLIYGFAPLEVLYRRDDDGSVGWKRWEIRNQDSVYGWKWDDAGDLASMVQRSAPDYLEIPIPIDKLIIFRMNLYRGNPEGFSILRTCYRAYYFKRAIEKSEAIGLDRNMAGFPLIGVPSHMMEAGASNEDKQALGEWELVGTRMRRDEQATVVKPNLYDEHGNNLYTFELIRAAGDSTVDTDRVIQRYKKDILDSAMGGVIMMSGGDVGSYALSVTMADLFIKALTAQADMICETITKQAFPRLLELNGIDPQYSPEMVHGRLHTANIAVLADAILKLTNAGFVFDADPEGAAFKQITDEMGMPDAAGKQPIQPTTPKSGTDGPSVGNLPTIGDVSPTPSPIGGESIAQASDPVADAKAAQGDLADDIESLMEDLWNPKRRARAAALAS